MESGLTSSNGGAFAGLGRYMPWGVRLQGVGGTCPGGRVCRAWAVHALGGAFAGRGRYMPWRRLALDSIFGAFAEAQLSMFSRKTVMRYDSNILPKSHWNGSFFLPVASFPNWSKRGNHSRSQRRDEHQYPGFLYKRKGFRSWYPERGSQTEGKR